MALPWSWILTSVVVLVSSGLQSMTGFGFAMVAVPCLVNLYDPRDAIVLSMVLSAIATVPMWRYTRAHALTGMTRPLFVAALLGLPLGFAVLRWINVDWLKLGVGVVTLAFAGMVVRARARRSAAVVPRDPALARLTSPARTFSAGLASGFLTGSLSMPGPPLMVLFQLEGVRKHAYRATSLRYFALIFPTAFATMAACGMISVSMLILAASHLPALLMGMWLGVTAHDAMPQSGFTAGTLAIQIVGGLASVWSGTSSLLLRP